MLAQSKPGPKPQPKALSPKQAVPLTANQKFVLDVVQSAVALPQSDPQDRLRVLASAANVVSGVNPKLARSFVREGMRIEQELIQSGETPAVSIMEGGQIDCSAVQGFIENVPPEKAAAAEQSLIAAVSQCRREGTAPVQRKLDAAMEQGIVAPRALLATIEQVGPRDSWSEQAFLKFFDSLPGKAADFVDESPNFSAMYERMAPEVSKEAARRSGTQLLLWLGKLPEGPSRNLAVNIATETMKNTLGPKAYEEALASDVMVRQVAESAGQPGQMKTPEEESVSVLEAMDKRSDQTDALAKLTPSLRARQAAANGYAAATNGNQKLAARYFDIAYSALNEVWSSRAERKDAPSVIEEVNEAAAQVGAVQALKRAQGLQDPSAQAIGMLAVARVVAGQQPPETAQKQ